MLTLGHCSSWCGTGAVARRPHLAGSGAAAPTSYQASPARTRAGPAPLLPRPGLRPCRARAAVMKYPTRPIVVVDRRTYQAAGRKWPC